MFESNYSQTRATGRIVWKKEKVRSEAGKAGNKESARNENEREIANVLLQE